MAGCTVYSIENYSLNDVNCHFQGPNSTVILPNEPFLLHHYGEVFLGLDLITPTGLAGGGDAAALLDLVAENALLERTLPHFKTNIVGLCWCLLVLTQLPLVYLRRQAL